jgi:hypothetical protein
MHTFCSHIGLLAAGRAMFLGVFMPRPSHYGENAHHMQEIPEGRGPAADKLPGLSKGSSGGRPPAEVKRAMHPDYAKREAKKTKSREQTKAANANQK